MVLWWRGRIKSPNGQTSARFVQSHLAGSKHRLHLSAFCEHRINRLCEVNVRTAPQTFRLKHWCVSVEQTTPQETDCDTPPTCLFALLCISFTSIIKYPHAICTGTSHPGPFTHSTPPPPARPARVSITALVQGSTYSLFALSVIGELLTTRWWIWPIKHVVIFNIPYFPLCFLSCFSSVGLSLQGSEDSSVHAFHSADTEIENLPWKNV